MAEWVKTADAERAALEGEQVLAVPRMERGAGLGRSSHRRPWASRVAFGRQDPF